jgi:RNA polymerase sigma factor (sigma-70 family)
MLEPGAAGRVENWDATTTQDFSMLDPNGFSGDVINLIPQLRGYARALTRDNIDADDLVQETLTKALRYHDRFTEGTRLKAWLFTIMRNTFYTAAKKRGREFPGSEDCVSSTVTVEPDHDRIMAHKELVAAINRLPRQYREMLVLVVVLGESYEAAAALCGCAIGTVKSRVNRARNMVIADLEGRKTGPAKRAGSDQSFHVS